MKKINCNVIRDLLPLYVDGAVCDDTRWIIEEHLQECPDCRKECELLGKELTLPADSQVSLEDAAVIKGFRKKWRSQKAGIAALSIALTFAACFALFQWMNSYEIYIPYDQNLFSVTSKPNGSVVIHYYGETFAGVREFGTDRTKSEAAAFDAETGESLEKQGYFYCYHTPWSKYVAPFFAKKDEKEHTFVLGQGENFDTIYYGNFDKNLDIKGEDYQKVWSRLEKS